MQRLLFAALAFLIVGAGPLHAQRPAPAQPPAAGPGEIRGRVVDAGTGAPVGSATVAVRATADSALVSGAITGADGSFRIVGLRPGAYSLRVSMMGYAVLTTPGLSVETAAPRVNAGNIALTRRAITLDAVEVTAEASPVTIAPDRNAYRVRDVAPAATTTSEVLEAVPSVEVDPAGRVSLRGNDDVVVQINGRPSAMRGEQLGAYLRQLPANTVERVEVVPNPSAKYDPEGMAGIINIVLKQNVDLGLSGGLIVSGSTADRYSASGNLGYQRGPATLLLSYGLSQEDRAIAGVNDRTLLTAQQDPFSFTEQDMRGLNADVGHNLNATLDYRLSARDVLSNAVLLNVSTENNESNNRYNELDATRLLLDSYERVRDEEGDAWMFDYILAFKRTFQPQRHDLSAEVRINGWRTDDLTALWRQPVAGGARIDAETQRTDTRSRLLAAQADYTRALGEKTKLEAGYKGTTRALDRDFVVRLDPFGTGEWVPGGLTNALTFNESVNAVYGVLSQDAGKLRLQAGLRAEYASRDFALQDTEGSFPHRYTSLFPSGLASYDLSESLRATVSYSRRIRRPGTQELNPFPSFFDLQNVVVGNPRLDPEYTDAVETSLRQSWRVGSLQLSPFYRRTTNLIRFVVNTADTIAGREVTSLSYSNIDTGSSWGVDLDGTLRLGSRLSGLASLNVHKMVTAGRSGESRLASDAVGWSARVNGTFKVTPKTSVTASYNYRAPRAIETGRFDAVSVANVSVRQQLFSDRMNLTLRVSDPFKTQAFRLRAGDDHVIQFTERTFQSRAVHLIVQTTFGRAPRLRQRRPDEEEETSLP